MLFVLVILASSDPQLKSSRRLFSKLASLMSVGKLQV